MLAKDPAARPQSASDYARKLTEVLERITLDQVPRLKKSAATFSRILPLTAVLLSAMVMAAGLYMAMRPQTDQLQVANPRLSASFGPPTWLVLQDAIHLLPTDHRKSEEKFLRASKMAAERNEPQYRMVAIGGLVTLYNAEQTKDFGKMDSQLAEAKRLLCKSPELKQKHGFDHTVGVAGWIENCADTSRNYKHWQDEEFFLQHAYDLLLSDKRNKHFSIFQGVIVKVGSKYVSILRKNGKSKTAKDVEAVVNRYAGGNRRD